MALSNRDYLIKLGFETNVKEIESQFQGADIDKEIDKWANSLKGFETVAKSFGKNFKNILSNFGEVKTINGLFNQFTEQLEAMDITINKINNHAVNLTGALGGLNTQSMKLTQSGAITNFTVGKSTAGNNLFPNESPESVLQNQTKRVGVSSDIAGADKTIKENLKLQMEKMLVDYGKLSKEQQDKLLSDFQDYASKMNIKYDKSGEMTRQWVELQINEYTKLSQAYKVVKANTVDGQAELLPVREPTELKLDFSKQRAAEQKRYNEYLAEEAKIVKELNALDNQEKKQSDAWESEQIKRLISDYKRLYEEKAHLQKLEASGANIDTLDKQRQKISQLESGISKYTDAQRNHREVVQYTTDATEKLRREQELLDNRVNRTGTSFGNFTKRLKQSAENTLIYGSLYKVFGLADQAIEASIQKIHELDTAMTNIQMVTGQTDEEVHKLIGSYSELGIKLGATTSQVAEGSIEWLRQGKTIEETNKLLTASTMLSKIGMIDSARSTELMTAALNGFNLSADDAIGIVDKLSAVDLSYATSAEEIATALQYVASSAGMAGVSLDKMIGLITVVSQTTRLGAEQIGQSFKTIIARMQNIKVGNFIDSESGEALLVRGMVA